jgi:spore maturation protein CgeB
MTRVLLFSNVSQKPFTNNLLPAVHGFQQLADVRVVEPIAYKGFVSTGGARPARVPDAAVADGLDGFAPDVVVCLGGGLYVEEATDAVTVGIALSDPLGLAASLEIAPRFDLFYTQDPGSVAEYRARGVEVRRCDLAVDPALLPVAPETKPDHDILYYGKWTPYRNEILSELARRFDVKVHTYTNEKRWSVAVDPPLEDSVALASALSRARIALELAYLDEAPEPYRGTFRITYRPFFAGACGVPSLIESFDLLPEFFSPGREIATFAAPGEAALQAERLLADDAARKRMGESARARVLHDHTWAARAAAILSDASAARKAR